MWLKIHQTLVKKETNFITIDGYKGCDYVGVYVHTLVAIK